MTAQEVTHPVNPSMAVDASLVAEHQARHERPSGRPPARPQRILVADDEHLVAIELTYTLAQLGYTVVGPVTDGLAAIELARKTLPDLALLDIRMPVLDGLSAAHELTAQLDIPCIIVSAYSEEAYVQTAGAVGVFGYAVKPVPEDQLRVCIDLAWRRYCKHVEERGENRTLRKRLEDRKVIEQAKWILVSTRGMTEPDAMRHLEHTSRNTRQPMLRVAQKIIEEQGTIAPK